MWVETDKISEQADKAKRQTRYKSMKGPQLKKMVAGKMWRKLPMEEKMAYAQRAWARKHGKEYVASANVGFDDVAASTASASVSFDVAGSTASASVSFDAVAGSTASSSDQPIFTPKKKQRRDPTRCSSVLLATVEALWKSDKTPEKDKKQLRDVLGAACTKSPVLKKALEAEVRQQLSPENDERLGAAGWYFEDL